MISNINLSVIRSKAVRFVAVVMIVAGLSACGGQDQQQAGSNQESKDAVAQALKLTSFRIRQDNGLALNDNQWTVDSNSEASILVDQPFRLRVEVENPGASTDSKVFSLQSRRNNGDWTDVAAEKFPYPSKDSEIDFSEQPESDATAKLSMAQGSQGALAWQENNGDGYMQLSSESEPVTALNDHDIFWSPEEFKAVLKLEDQAQTSLLVGYQDADNHYRLELQGGGAMSLIERRAGQDQVVKQFDVALKAGQWIEVGLTLSDGEIAIEYEWDPIIEGMSWDVEIAGLNELAGTGLHLPAQNSVDIQAIELSADATSPLVSIVSSDAYDNGAQTEDLLSGSELAFVAGSGVSYAPTTAAWTGAESHGEWEFAMVFRYFADGALNNLDGDRYEFRIVDEAGQVASAESQPSVVVNVPDGHLGGTFVETPGRLGPWQSANGDMYFLIEPSETDNKMMIVKSTNRGSNWLEEDGENRPATGDLEGVSTRFDGNSIHILHQTSDDVLYHKFNVNETEQGRGWVIRDEVLASPSEPPVQVSDLAIRSDGSIVGVYGDLHKVLYQIRSASGEWGEATVIDPNLKRDLSGPVLVKGKDDEVHLAYTGFDGTAWYRKILASGELSDALMISSDMGQSVEDAGSILPLVYQADIDSVSVIYRVASGELWERRVENGKLIDAVQVTQSKVVRNAADSEQVGADAVAAEGAVNVLFISEETGGLFHTHRKAGGDWVESSLIVDADGILWVRGAVVEDAQGQKQYGFVYDAGSGGGSGLNRYGQVSLQSE